MPEYDKKYIMAMQTWQDLQKMREVGPAVLAALAPICTCCGFRNHLSIDETGQHWCEACRFGVDACGQCRLHPNSPVVHEDRLSNLSPVVPADVLIKCSVAPPRTREPEIETDDPLPAGWVEPDDEP